MNLPVLPLAPSSPRLVTTNDVALAAGVPRASVSVVLNGARSSSKVSEEKRQRILDAAEQLGYRRNGSAANMARGKFGCVALLLSTRPNVSTLPQPVWEGIHDELALHGLHLSLFRLPDADITDETLIPKCLTEWMADGLIVDYTHEIPAKLGALIEDNRLPAIWFNTLRDDDCVRPDDYGAGVMAAEHLLELGHRRIAYIDFSRQESDFADFGKTSAEHYSTFHRYRGVCDAMREFGVAPSVCARRAGDNDDNIEARRYGYLLELLQKTRPSAIVTYSRPELPLLAARDLGLSVPAQLSVVDFALDKARVLEHEMSSVIHPQSESGRQLVRQLLRKINDPSVLLPPHLLPFEFTLGQTTGPAPTR